MRKGTLHLIMVWFALLVLLSLTLTASFLPLGSWNPVVSIGIAILKSALIFWFYMHLKEEGGLVRLVALGAAAWLLILLLLISSDVVTRDWF